MYGNVKYQRGTDLNSTLRDAEFKDASPRKTVERIKGILNELGIETQEIWNESGVPYCFGITIRFPAPLSASTARV